MKLCNLCFSFIGKGKSHKCNSTSLVTNMSNLVSTSSSTAQSQIISQLVKSKESKKYKDDKQALSVLQLSQRRGRPIKIVVDKKKQGFPPKSTMLSTEDLIAMKNDMNLSDRETIKMAASIRAGTKNKKAIEPGLKRRLSDKAHSVDEFFSYKEFPLVNIKGNEVSNAPKVVTYCKNIPAFIQHVRRERNVSEDHLKLGIDGGGGFLKICLSIQSTSNMKSEALKKGKKRAKYDEGIAANKFKDSGVKRLFILAAVPNSQENYENVAQLFTALNISPFNGTIATDLKLANILVGIMSHSSAHPCTYCYAKNSELHSCGELRSAANVLKNYNKWLTEGKGSKRLAKEYFNCVHPPLITTADDKTFLEIIPPPELHLMLGVVNTVFTYMLKECENEAQAWADACHVQREITHGGSGFKGNACRTLLENIDILRSSSNLAVLKYVKVFDDFKNVVSACFGNVLNKNYATCVKNFRKSYMSLGVSVTPKVHAVFFHVEQFCIKTGTGLGFFSEQAMESVHYDFKTTWLKNKVGENHPDYATKLLRAVCSYNALHI